MPNNKPIGFFDSGVGGLSVLREAIRFMPSENFVYYGDSLNAPYGTKKYYQVKELSFKAVEFLIDKGVKAIVVACNTATSVAIEEIRSKYSNIPIIGIEPALKPAVEQYGDGKIIVMATPITLSEKKFNKLISMYEEKADIMPMPCGGLAELIEKGNLDGEEIDEYIMDKYKNINVKDISSIVLGCTHYPFIIGSLRKIIGRSIPIIDGSCGTVKHLKNQLTQLTLVNNSINRGEVTIYNSSLNKEVIDFSYKLLKL